MMPDACAWDDSRCDELESFGLLLYEVSMINNGSHCLERIARCIELARGLQRSDLGIEHPSFRGFLNSLALADRNTACERAEAAGLPAQR